MFWKKNKPPEKLEPPVGSLRIVPGWDGSFHIEECDIDFPPFLRGQVLKRWKAVAVGFESRISAMERIAFMEKQNKVIKTKGVQANAE